MSENWDIYFGYIDNKIASVVLDLDIWQEIDNEKFNHSFCLRLKLKEPNEDGFPIGKEAEVINEIEDSLIAFLDHKNFINVGRVTTDGFRDVIFYSDQELKNALIDAAHQFVKPAGYEFEIFDIEEDSLGNFIMSFYTLINTNSSIWEINKFLILWKSPGIN